MKSVLLVSAITGLAAAHFELQYPPPVAKFNDDTEGDAPCGGPSLDFKNAKFVDFHVGGESLAMTSTHPQSGWLFRATTDNTTDPTWEQLFPIVLQSGIGAFCEPQVTVPESYIGKKGYVSVVSSAVDGLLYQVCDHSSILASLGRNIGRLGMECADMFLYSVSPPTSSRAKATCPPRARTPLPSKPPSPPTPNCRLWSVTAPTLEPLLPLVPRLQALPPLRHLRRPRRRRAMLPLLYRASLRQGPHGAFWDCQLLHSGALFCCNRRRGGSVRGAAHGILRGPERVNTVLVILAAYSEAIRFGCNMNKKIHVAILRQSTLLYTALFKCVLLPYYVIYHRTGYISRTQVRES